MAQTNQEQWRNGVVKSVLSGDSLVLMQNTNFGAPEKTITLSCIRAPRLAHKGFYDDSFAWDSREYLRKLCIGKNVVFREDLVPQQSPRSLGDKKEGNYDTKINRNFGTVFLGDKNLAELIVSQGLAEVKTSLKDRESPFMLVLKRAQDQAKKENVGIWTLDSAAKKRAVRFLPPSAVGDFNAFNAVDFLATNKGSPMEAIVEYVRDGTTLRMYLLPSFEKVQVYVAGVQAPSTRKKTDSGSSVDTKSYAEEAKHFTEMRVLNRDVHVVFEGVDKFNNLIGSVHYLDEESTRDLAMELVTNGLTKYVEWSGNLLEEDVKNQLKSAELEAKKNQLKMWEGFVELPICEQKFTGKVIEIGNGGWIVVADDASQVERRVYLSSISCPKMGNPRNNETPENYAYEARELLRKRLIGQQVNVSMEYHRTITFGEQSDKTRVVDYGSVFVCDGSKATLQTINVAKILVDRGYASVVEHRVSDDRSSHYADLIAAEARAIAKKKGIYSGKEYVVKHLADLTEDSTGAKNFLPSLQKKKMGAIVEYILSGHRFKLFVPEESSYITFSLSGIRCPGRNDPCSKEAIAFMRKMILHRDVQIQVDKVDQKATFLGCLWISGTNIALTLVQAGLASVPYNVNSIPDGNLLMMAEQSAKKKQLMIWKNFKEGESTFGPVARGRTKQMMKVKVTQILEEGSFNVKVIDDNNRSQLCKLAYLKVPNSVEDYGKEAALWLKEALQGSNSTFSAIIERTDHTSTGPILEVILIEDMEPYESINGYMLEAGLARIARFRGFRSKEVRDAMKTLEPYQEEARCNRWGMWEYGDIPSDDDDKDIRPVGGAGTAKR